MMTKMNNSKLTNANELTPHTWYKALLVIGIIVGVGWYGAFQARNLLEGPRIALHSPTETAHHEQMITVTGDTENIVALSLNGKSIFTDETGQFTEKLVLEQGYTIMTLTATDRYGRETRVSRPLIYTPNE